ncbi:hypothetical protein CI109_102352 [Kwoniella shandongensis]|uniref:Uncharacterized protein n=1 Tax=Kwoniella shandongensis TaxID=1734106 RepID=A0A5M6C1E7_9TREE|nr:uncharacterized protein CI109_003330 [Kwoniella shandongensis]KAA5528430.1 hypothetical protein CI109_003330 [Kwoniella shandongensis]
MTTIISQRALPSLALSEDVLFSIVTSPPIAKTIIFLQQAFKVGYELVKQTLSDEKNRVIMILSIVILILLNLVGSRARLARLESRFSYEGDNEEKSDVCVSQIQGQQCEGDRLRGKSRLGSESGITRSTVLTIRRSTIRSRAKPKSKPIAESDIMTNTNLKSDKKHIPQPDTELTPSEFDSMLASCSTSPHSNLTQVIIPSYSSIWPETYLAALAMAMETDGIVLLRKGWVTRDLVSGKIAIRNDGMTIDELLQREWKGIEWID